MVGMKWRDLEVERDRLRSSHHYGSTVSCSDSRATDVSKLSSQGTGHSLSGSQNSSFRHPYGTGPPLEVYGALCRAFQSNTCSLNSPWYKINQAEFAKVLNSAAHYKSLLSGYAIEWGLELGGGSSSFSEISEEPSLVCHVLSRRHRVLGKVVVTNLVRKLISPQTSFEQRTNHKLLERLGDLTNSTIKDRYQAPPNHVRLADITNTITRPSVFGVVTAVNKTPTRTRQYWHSLICISDPSLVSENDGAPPSEFKMHLFMSLLEDFKELHRGDVVRFSNVKIESHLNRCDGRIFNKGEMSVYCLGDSQAPVPYEHREDRSIVVRLLSSWWTLNAQFFDSLTPWPIYHAHSRYPGLRCFKELSDQLVCDVYCQVVGISDESSELPFCYVRDGTIFTLEDRNQPAPPSSDAAVGHCDERTREETPTYGHMGLLVFDMDHWRRVKPLKIAVYDYLLLKEVKAIFIAQETFTSLGQAYPYRHPCILLRPNPSADGLKKIPADHHESVKIRKRLHRLPDALEQMTTWQLPALHADEIPDDPLLARMADPSVQQSLLKRLKRS